MMKEDKLEVIHTPLNKTVYKMQPNIQEYMNFVDFQINSVTKEVVLLSNN